MRARSGKLSARGVTDTAAISSSFQGAGGRGILTLPREVAPPQRSQGPAGLSWRSKAPASPPSCHLMGERHGKSVDVMQSAKHSLQYSCYLFLPVLEAWSTWGS